MKTLILVAALIATPAHAFTPAECKAMSEYAVAVMDAQRAGTQIAEILRATDQIPNAAIRLWAKKFAVDIYITMQKAGAMSSFAYQSLRQATLENIYVLCTESTQ